MNGELEIRSAQVTDVSFPKRLVELVVMPYEVEAPVVYHGRAITEICSRGAYDGVQQRSRQIRVNRGHDRERPVGRTLALHPTRPDGLVAEIRISRTELGEETLVLAEDGILDASAGFALLADPSGRVHPDAEVWETRSRRRLNRLHLDHIALTAIPAYDGARVLSVRSNAAQDEPPPTSPATPNLDRLELDRLRAVYAGIDRRYGLGR